MLENFLGSHMLENSGGCRASFEGGNYGTMLQYHTTIQGNGTRRLVEHPGSANLSSMM